jgi:hypothetical protein
MAVFDAFGLFVMVFSAGMHQVTAVFHCIRSAYWQKNHGFMLSLPFYILMR